MSLRKEGIQFTKEPFIEDLGPKIIKSIKFSNLSESDVFKAAEVQVYRGLYYDSKKKPIENGLLDPRMGPPNKSSMCATCHGNFTTCPGHYGYLPLALPVYNVGYLGTIVDILKCICKDCARILLPEDRVQSLKNTREPDMLKKIVKMCNGTAVTCSRCGYVNGMVKKAAGRLDIIHERSHINAKELEEARSAISHTREAEASIKLNPILNPDRVLSLFKRMLDADYALLYQSERPENLLITSILVPPLAIRPSVFLDGGTQSNESDITQRLRHIIEANASLQQELSDTSDASRSLLKWADLQAEVALYINSDAPVPNLSMKNDKNQKVLSGFLQRLKGKQGRFRGNLSGKRVEYTGRTVITPDPNLKITELGVPLYIALKLTYPEKVTQHNIEKLRLCVRNGPDKYPGAKSITEPNGDSWILVSASVRKRRADDLKFGVLVHRHLEDGDIVLFNRQPSLHRMSIMCHRAKIMEGRTLRFNVSVCNPYNADFDGDEMNIHVPQTEEARTEALMLMGVQNNLCTPKNGEILVAPTQDFLTSSFLITRKDTFYDRATFCLFCCYMGDGVDHVDLPTPALIKPIELWTGKQLFNVLLRPHSNVKVYLNFTVKEKNYKKNDERETMSPFDVFVYFRNSELISGQLGKVTLGSGNKDGLYSVLLRDYGSHGAAVCMNRLAKLSARYIGDHGFSIGIDDVQPGEKLNENKRARVSEGYAKCEGLIQSYNKGQIEPLSGCDAAQTLEARITGVLNSIRETAASVCMEELHWRNSPLIMSQCGSKGSPSNISQMIACVGQQSVGGKRAPDGFIDRSLPHFPTNSKLPSAKGFVANSFYSGLTPTEFFFHTMGGREGLVDTAVKTADTGYMSRRLIKALEDLSIQYDNTVRNASGCIVQFVYGDDGMDPSLMEAQEGRPLNFGRLLLKAKATCPPGEEASLTPSDILNVCCERLSRSNMTCDGGCPSAFKKSLSEFVQECCKRFKSTRTALKLENEQVSGQNCNTLENMAQNISGLTPTQLKMFLETCIYRYHSKKIEYGTAIGAIGAQSIGEPGTQMTLKTFHFAGVASMNVTLGVPRIKEIINASKKISTPIITAELECGDNPKFARMVKDRVEKTTLGQVAKSVKIVMSSMNAYIAITLDVETIHASQLSINAQIVKEAILRTRGIKLKYQHIKVLDARKLEVNPPADEGELLSNLRFLSAKLPKLVVKGINTVERAVVNIKSEDKKDKGDTTKKKKYNMLVEGTGLLAVMGTEGVDGRYTTSNHIMEVKDALGIEAARTCIIREIQYTMGLHGMSIDGRHMMLLADLMTFKGEILGITRHGIQKMKDSVLMLASFEKTADHLFNASANGRIDKIDGVSECIIMGIPMKLGTGIFKVLQRVDKVQKLDYGLDPIIQ